MDNRNCVGFNFGALFENSCMSTALIKTSCFLLEGVTRQKVPHPGAAVATIESWNFTYAYHSPIPAIAIGLKKKLAS
jgi:hypothetical protein